MAVADKGVTVVGGKAATAEVVRALTAVVVKVDMAVGVRVVTAVVDKVDMEAVKVDTVVVQAGVRRCLSVSVPLLLTGQQMAVVKGVVGTAASRAVSSPS